MARPSRKNPDVERTKELDAWVRDLDALASEIPPEEFDRLEAALARAEQESKEYVRKQMGLPDSTRQ